MKKLIAIFKDPQNFMTLILCIVFVALILRLYRLSDPPTYYFDEVYHAFTATTYLHNDPKGYEYWQTPPKGVAYEWTHPPLAKLFMAGGMVVFGENSYGYRISSALFGTAIILLIGVLAQVLFHRKMVTLLAVLFATFDGLLLAMSRIAMNDVHFIAFLLASITCYVFFKRLQQQSKIVPALKYAFLSALLLGLSFSSKWTAVYAGIGLVIDQLVTIFLRFDKKRLRIALLAFPLFTILPFCVYLMSYSQFFLQGHTIKQFQETQQQMWWYHTRLVATHSYQSRPWQWIMDLRPVWLYVNYSDSSQGIVANIYNTDNPVILWSGIVTVVLLVLFIAYQVISKKAKRAVPWELLFVLLLYCMLWMPWILSPRIMFFYHYTPAVPFLCILLSYGLVRFVWPNKQLRWIVPTLVVLAGLGFIVLYPMNTGLPMPKLYFDTIFSIFPTWK